MKGTKSLGLGFDLKRPEFCVWVEACVSTEGYVSSFSKDLRTGIQMSIGSGTLGRDECFETSSEYTC